MKAGKAVQATNGERGITTSDETRSGMITVMWLGHRNPVWEQARGLTPIEWK